MKSTTLDKWDCQWVELMARAGNVRVNACFEARLTDRSRKLRPTSTMEERERYIRAKYERREFFGQPTKESLMRACGEVDMPFSSLPPNYITGVDTTAVSQSDLPGGGSNTNISTNPALLRRQQKKDAEEGAARKAAEDAERDARERASMEARLRLEQEQASIRATTSSLGDLFGGTSSHHPNQALQRTQNAANSILAQFNAPSIGTTPFTAASSMMTPCNAFSQGPNLGAGGNMFDSMNLSSSPATLPSFEQVSLFPAPQMMQPQPQSNIFASMSVSTSSTTPSASTFSLPSVSQPLPNNALSSTGFSFMGSAVVSNVQSFVPLGGEINVSPSLPTTTFNALQGSATPAVVSIPNKTAALSSFLDAVAADAATIATHLPPAQHDSFSFVSKSTIDKSNHVGTESNLASMSTASSSAPWSSTLLSSSSSSSTFPPFSSSSSSSSSPTLLSSSSTQFTASIPEDFRRLFDLPSPTSLEACMKRQLALTEAYQNELARINAIMVSISAGGTMQPSVSIVKQSISSTTSSALPSVPAFSTEAHATLDPFQKTQSQVTSLQSPSTFDFATPVVGVTQTSSNPSTTSLFGGLSFSSSSSSSSSSPPPPLQSAGSTLHSQNNATLETISATPSLSMDTVAASAMTSSTSFSAYPPPLSATSSSFPSRSTTVAGQNNSFGGVTTSSTMPTTATPTSASMFGGMSFAPVSNLPTAVITPLVSQGVNHSGVSSYGADDEESSGPPPAPPDEEEDYQSSVVGNSAISVNQASISSMFG